MNTLDNVKDAPLKTREHVTGWYATSREFLQDVRNELKRVTWPSRKEVYATTVVVILTSVFFGVYLWGLDVGLSVLINAIFKRFAS